MSAPVANALLREAVERLRVSGRWSAEQLEGLLDRRRVDLQRLALEVLGRQGEDGSWFSRYNPKVDPGAGWRNAIDQADDLVDFAQGLVRDPHAAMAIAALLDGDDGEIEDDDAWISSLVEEVVDLVGGPMGWSADEVADFLGAVLDYDEFGGSRADLVRSTAERIYGGPAGRLVLLPVDKRLACAYVERHHSALPECNPRGMMYAIGAYFGGRLVAVATAGTPTARWGPPCPQSGTLELTRIASEGGLRRVDRRGRDVPVNASSALASRLIDLLPQSGRGSPGCRFVTYSLTDEEGSTYLALLGKGLRPVGRVAAAAPSGARAGSAGGLKGRAKVVWEAGPAARPPDWTVLPEHRRQRAARAFANRRA